VADGRSALDRLDEIAIQQWALERGTIDLIASDNAVGPCRSSYPGAIIQEGRLDHRPFAGARWHDEIERLAAAAACDLFGAEHANVQPHSCSQANQSAYAGVLQLGDPVVALDLISGGHLTHGLASNFSGRSYRFRTYRSRPNGWIDYDNLDEVVAQHRPRLVVCGSSSYPRLYDLGRLRAAADSVGALLMLDLSHEAGLIAGGAVANPIPHADIVTLSMDKTLRGPFGGLVLCRADLADRIDRAVHPGTQSSFPIRRLFDAAEALIGAATPDFATYARRVVALARRLADVLADAGVTLVTGGTDKHYVVADVTAAFGISGLEAEQRLESIGILSNRQTLPTDTRFRMNDASGVRLGTAWLTSRGYTEDDVAEVAQLVVAALANPTSASAHRDQVAGLVACDRPDDVWRGHDASA
jgi:glycine hydroxymethyltransferase